MRDLAPPPNPTCRRRGARALARAALACALAAGFGSPARASDLSASANFGAGYDETMTTESDYLRQTYQLGYRRKISAPLGYALTLNYQDDRGTERFEGVDALTRSRQLFQGARGTWTLDDFSLALSSDLNWSSQYDGEADQTLSQRIHRFGGTTRYSIVDEADVNLYANRLAYSGDRLDTTYDRVGLAFNYLRGGLRIQNTNRAEMFEDRIEHASRLGVGPRISAEYLFVQKRWSAGVRYDMEYFRAEQRSLVDQALSVPADVGPVAGLYGIDDLPADTALLPTEGRLIDGALDTTAGINLGPGGVSFHNIGVDMGSVVTLHELRVHVRNGIGQPVPFGGSITWTVYSSNNGTQWALVDGQMGSFRQELSAYVFGFAATSARFFKAVSFGINTVETFVTEIQPFARETFSAGQVLVAHSFRNGVGATATAMLSDRITTSYRGRLNRSAGTGFAGKTRESTDFENALAAKLGPFDEFTFDLGFSQLYAAAGALDQSRVVSSAAATYRPIDTFSTTLDGRHVAERVGVIRSTTLGTSVSAAADVYRSLRTSGSVGYSTRTIEGNGTSQYVSGTGRVDANVRPELDLQLELGMTRSVSESGAAAAVANIPLLQIVTYERYAATARYRPSVQLELQGRVGFVSTDTSSGVIRTLGARWDPFPGGAIRISFDYSVEVDPLTGRSYRQLSVQPQWLINRHASLSVRYNDIRGTGDIRQQSVNMSLGVKL